MRMAENITWTRTTYNNRVDILAEAVNASQGLRAPSAALKVEWVSHDAHLKLG